MWCVHVCMLCMCVWRPAGTLSVGCAYRPRAPLDAAAEQLVELVELDLAAAVGVEFAEERVSLGAAHSIPEGSECCVHITTVPVARVHSTHTIIGERCGGCAVVSRWGNCVRLWVAAPVGGCPRVGEREGERCIKIGGGGALGELCSCEHIPLKNSSRLTVPSPSSSHSRKISITRTCHNRRAPKSTTQSIGMSMSEYGPRACVTHSRVCQALCMWHHEVGVCREAGGGMHARRVR